MKISSSTVEYSSTHFLGTQEREDVQASTATETINQTAIHTEEQQDVAYDVQLTGQAAKQAGADSSKGIYQAVSGGGGTDVEAQSEAELAKLSPEDRQKVQQVQNYVGLMTGGKIKVVVAPESVQKAQDMLSEMLRHTDLQQAQLIAPVITSGEINLNVKTGEQSQEIQGTIITDGTQVAGEMHSRKTTDSNEVNVSIDNSHQYLGGVGNWQTIGTITESSQSVATSQNSSVLGQQLSNYSSNTPVDVPSYNANGTSTGLRTGDSTWVSKETTEEEYTAWSEKGTIQTEDGRVINLDKTSLMYRTAEVDQSQKTTNIDDPLVIQYGGGNVGLTEQKYSFDLNGDGQQDGISFTKAGAGFLALDGNGDGKINDGSELFGTKSGNGFKDLAKYDEDGNGWIDENDAVYNKLRLYSKDEQGNDQLMTLKEAGVGAIYLGSTSTEFAIKDQDNNLEGQVRQSGFFLREDGTAGTVQQIDLARGSAPTGDKVATGTIISGASADEWKSVQTAQQTDIKINSSHVIAETVGNGFVIHNQRPTNQIVLTNTTHISIDEQSFTYGEQGKIYGQGVTPVASYDLYKAAYSKYQEINVLISNKKLKATTNLNPIGKVNYANNTMDDFTAAKAFVRSTNLDVTLNFLNNIFQEKHKKKSHDDQTEDTDTASTAMKAKTLQAKSSKIARNDRYGTVAAHSSIAYKYNNFITKAVDLKL